MFLTVEDRRRLQRARLDRFTKLLPVHPQALLLGLNGVLYISVTSSHEVDILLADKTELRSTVYLVLGCDRVEVWSAQQRAWASDRFTTVTPT
jgi:hypothetical protein